MRTTQRPYRVKRKSSCPNFCCQIFLLMNLCVRKFAQPWSLMLSVWREIMCHTNMLYTASFCVTGNCWNNWAWEGSIRERRLGNKRSRANVRQPCIIICACLYPVVSCRVADALVSRGLSLVFVKRSGVLRTQLVTSLPHMPNMQDQCSYTYYIAHLYAKT